MLDLKKLVFSLSFVIVSIAAALAYPNVARAETIRTQSFGIKITRHCEEGNISGDRVTYVSKSLKTGKSITLTGKTLNRSETYTLVAQKIKKYQTVAEYFLSMPAKYLENPARVVFTGSDRQQMLNSAKRGKNGLVYDLKNGYLSLTPERGSDLCGSFQIAVFNRPNNTPLVARTIACTDGDRLIILDPDRNWQDVTATVIDVNDKLLVPAPDRMVKLPRVGRNIEFYGENKNGGQKLIGKYSFNGNRFVRN